MKHRKSIANYLTDINKSSVRKEWRRTRNQPKSKTKKTKKKKSYARISIKMKVTQWCSVFLSASQSRTECPHSMFSSTTQDMTLLSTAKTSMSHSSLTSFFSIDHFPHAIFFSQSLSDYTHLYKYLKPIWKWFIVSFSSADTVVPGWPNGTQKIFHNLKSNAFWKK